MRLLLTAVQAREHVADSDGEPLQRVNTLTVLFTENFEGGTFCWSPNDKLSGQHSKLMLRTDVPNYVVYRSHYNSAPLVLPASCRD